MVTPRRQQERRNGGHKKAMGHGKVHIKKAWECQAAIANRRLISHSTPCTAPRSPAPPTRNVRVCVPVPGVWCVGHAGDTCLPPLASFVASCSLFPSLALCLFDVCWLAVQSLRGLQCCWWGYATGRRCWGVVVDQVGVVVRQGCRHSRQQLIGAGDGERGWGAGGPAVGGGGGVVC